MKRIIQFIICSFLLILLMQAGAISLDKSTKDGNTIQRQSTGVFDLQQNTVSNIEFYTTNYGIFGHNSATTQGGGYWPRGSLNQYIFAGNFWFGAQKFRPDTNLMRKYVAISYNPNTGRSWFVPGRAEDGNSIYDHDTKKYRNYFSTDFDRETGLALEPSDGPNWPIWNDGSKFGKYVNVNNRNRNDYPLGPLIKSEEDIFSTYKDTDLIYYDGGETNRKQQGYPLGLQVNQTIYTWGSEEMKDIAIIRYEIENVSDKPLYECWFAPLWDVDIARAPNTTYGAGNDRVIYYEADTTLNTCVAWTQPNRGEGGYGFGYIGITFLESPAVYESGSDSADFIRNDKPFFDYESQLGLVTFRNWDSEENISDDEDRYNYMSLGVRDGDNGPNDKRILFSTGPFNMRPGDIAKAAVMITFSNTAKGGEADGTNEDLEKLISKVRKGIDYYYRDFLTAVETELSGSETDLLISPNPAENNTMLSFNMPNSSSGSVEIVNVVGQVLYRNDTEFTSGLNYININTSSFPAGVYYVNIRSGNFMMQKQLIVAR